MEKETHTLLATAISSAEAVIFAYACILYYYIQHNYVESDLKLSLFF